MKTILKTLCEAIINIISVLRYDEDECFFDTLSTKDERILSNCVDIVKKYEVDVKCILNNKEVTISRVLTKSYATVVYDPNWRVSNNYNHLVKKGRQREIESQL